MSSNIEAEMARFEEEILSVKDSDKNDFHPPPLPPIMPPPMFLPHALQSGNKQKSPRSEDNQFRDNSQHDKIENNSHHNAQAEHHVNNLPGPALPIHSGPISGRPPHPGGPATGPPNFVGPHSMPPGPMISRPIGPGPFHPGPLMPGGPSPNSILPGMIGPNAGPINPMVSGPLRPNIDSNMMGPMPPPMPSFFPPPVLPDFSQVNKSQQTVYAAAPVLKKKNEDSASSHSSLESKQQSAEKGKTSKRSQEVAETSAAINTISKSDDKLSEVGPEAGPHVGPHAALQMPVMPPPASFGSRQPALYGLSPLAGNPQLAKEAAQASKRKKIIRTAAGQKWDDPSLLDWDANDYRIFCGDLGNEVTDDTLARVFSRYTSFQKARVVREKNSKKSKGYGFVSFKDPNDFIRAMREINGKYVGNRPIKLRKSNWKDRNIEVVRKKMKEKKKLGYKV